MKLCALFFWVGIGGLGVSGMVPMFRLHHEQISVELTYFIYFLLSVLMQIGVYFFAALRRIKPMFLLSQLGFAFTLVAFGFYAISGPVEWNANYIYLLRAIEGLSMGLAMPLAFEMIVSTRSKLKITEKILYLNLANLLGFILGAPLFERLMKGGQAGWLFVGIGVLTFAVATGLTLFSAGKESMVLEAAVSIEVTRTPGRWTDRYFYNFLAKLFFGYLLTMIAVDAGFLPFSLPAIPLILATVFFSAQVILVQALKKISLVRLELPIVLALAVALGLHLVTGSYVFILLAMGFQSMVQFVGLEKISETPQTSKEFALINSMSDPGQVLGAALCQVRFLPPEAFMMVIALLPLFWRAQKKVQNA